MSGTNSANETVATEGFLPQGPVDLTITGMSCAACVLRVEKVLSRLKGVERVSVNLGTEKARLEVEGNTLHLSDLVDAVEKAGYGARAVHEGPPDEEVALDEKRARETEVVMFGLSLVLTLPLLWDMVAHMTGLPGAISPIWQLILASIVQFGPGWCFYKGAFKALRSGTGTMDTLVALGTTAAWGFSFWRTTHGQAHDGLYFESSAVVITLVLLGRLLEARAKRSAASAIRALMNLTPPIAHLEINGQVTDVEAATLKAGDVVLVRMGEVLPADGEILEGTGTFDESLITGESLPVARRQGDRVIGGALLAEGTLRVTVTAAGAESTLARMIRLVEDAQAAKAPVQYFVDKVAAIFVPFVIVVAALTFGGWWLATGGQTEGGLVAAISVLVVACPCALGLATPTAIMVGTGLAAKRGILIRDTTALERTCEVQTMVFDKTGTLTVGRPDVRDIILSDQAGLTRADVLQWAASVQQQANHPLARAIRDAAKAQNLPVLPVTNFESQPGLGVSAQVENRRLFLGSRAYITTLGGDMTALEDQARSAEGQGASVVWAALADPSGKGQVIALFVLADPPRDSAGTAIRRLKKMGLRPVMLTGDSPRVAQAIGEPLGIEERIAGVDPAGKAAVIENLRRGPTVVAMVGDGVNDAPALAQADVGIAMGSGSDAAMETATITLMHSDPNLLPDAISLSKATVKRIRLNLFWAFGYNVLAIPLAAGGFLSPMLAGSIMALSSVSVVTSSLLLRRWKPEGENA